MLPAKSNQPSGRIGGIFTVLSQLLSEKDGNLTINFDESFTSALKYDAPSSCEFQ